MKRPPSNHVYLRARTDDGLVGSYTPAQGSKPKGMIARAVAKLSPLVKWIRPKDTTAQGTGVASPSTYLAQILALRYDYRGLIQDARMIYDTDPRVRSSVDKYCEEAVRKGCMLTVNMEKTPNVVGARAQVVLLEASQLINPKLLAWTRAQFIEGNLYLEAVLNGDEDGIYDFARRPAISMERMTDDADQFHDPARAFVQLDTATNQEFAHFPLALMLHSRWNHWDGDKYGTSGLMVARRAFRMLWLLEEAQALRRLSRAALRRLWIFGGKDGNVNPGDIANFKTENGMVGGKIDPMDPMSQAIDFFGSNVEVETLDSDPNIEKIDDLIHAQDVAMAGCPTPGSLLNINAKDTNRDVLEEQRAEWLKKVQIMSDIIKVVIKWCADVALLAAGIDPDQVTYSITLSDSSPMTAAVLIPSLIQLYEAGALTLFDLVRLTQEFTGVQNINDTVEELKKQDAASKQQELEMQLKTMAAKNASRPGAKAPPKPGTAAKDEIEESESYRRIMNQLKSIVDEFESEYELGHNHGHRNGKAVAAAR